MKCKKRNGRILFVCGLLLLLSMESNRFSERDTCTVNKGKNAAAVTDKKTRQDTAVNKKSHGLYSPSGEDISSKIQKIFLNGKEIDISTYTVTVDTIDASKIKAVSTKHIKDSIWLYIDTK